MRSSAISHPGPHSGRLAYWIGRLYLALAGWKVEGELPQSSKAVLIAAPHTSNWDLPLLLAVAWVFRLRVSWLGKHTIFRGWRDRPMRWLGGIPVDRRAPQGLVAQVAQRYAESDALVLAVPPSGTRKWTPWWKSGFYQIALAAQVPIVCGFLDYRRRVGGVGPAFVPTGDVGADMDRLRAFYGPIQGCHPQRKSVIALRSEVEPDAPDPLAEEPLVVTSEPERDDDAASERPADLGG